MKNRTQLAQSPCVAILANPSRDIQESVAYEALPSATSHAHDPRRSLTSSRDPTPPAQSRPARRPAAYQLRAGNQVGDRPALREEGNRSSVGGHHHRAADQDGQTRARRCHVPLAIDAHDGVLQRVRVIGVLRAHALEFALKLRVWPRRRGTETGDRADEPPDRIPRTEHDDRLAQAGCSPRPGINPSNTLVRAFRDAPSLLRDSDRKHADPQQGSTLGRGRHDRTDGWKPSHRPIVCPLHPQHADPT